MMETYISFYLKANRIHVFVDALREIGSPKRICFMISDDGKTLLVVPYQKRDFVSHKVPSEVYKGVGGMEVLAPGENRHFEPGKFSQFWPEPGTNPAQWVRLKTPFRVHPKQPN